MSLWSVFRGNKQDPKTVGEFLTHAIDHIRNGGNVASCETKLSDGTPILISLKRVTASDAGSEHG